MQKDFHYYATYCAAYLAGFSHDECMDICYSAQFVDCCSATYLSKIGAPRSAATTQLQLELMSAGSDILSLQNITRIWSSFHFLPGDLYAYRAGCTGIYLSKYRLICKPNGMLLAATVRNAMGRSLQAAGIAMHVLADTWAHQNFAGTPSLVINNTDDYFYEIMPLDDAYDEHRITFRHSTTLKDDPDEHIYVNSPYQGSEHSIMNLGHGRAGHLPDYSFIRYKYLPAWGDYEEIVKDNPADYLRAFTQMIYALKYLRRGSGSFEVGRYDTDAMIPHRAQIEGIIRKRQTDSCDDWRSFGQSLSGCEIEDFDIDKYQAEYMQAENASRRDETFLGRFLTAALSQKSMVTHEIFTSGNLLAGFSIDGRLRSSLKKGK